MNVVTSSRCSAVSTRCISLRYTASPVPSSSNRLPAVEPGRPQWRRRLSKPVGSECAKSQVNWASSSYPSGAHTRCSCRQFSTSSLLGRRMRVLLNCTRATLVNQACCLFLIERGVRIAQGGNVSAVWQHFADDVKVDISVWPSEKKLGLIAIGVATDRALARTPARPIWGRQWCNCDQPRPENNTFK